MQARRDEITAELDQLEEQNLFELLGLDVKASGDDIQQAYLDVARKWHPDRLPSELADMKVPVSKIFARMNDAFQTLSREDKRKDYLERLAIGGGTPDEDAKVSRLVDFLWPPDASEHPTPTVIARGPFLSGPEHLRAWDDPESQPHLVKYRPCLDLVKVGPPPPLRRTLARADRVAHTSQAYTAPSL